MREVVIAGYLRTAQSRSRPNDPARDWFCQMRSDELLAKILPEVINSKFQRICLMDSNVSRQIC